MGSASGSGYKNKGEANLVEQFKLLTASYGEYARFCSSSYLHNI